MDSEKFQGKTNLDSIQEVAGRSSIMKKMRMNPAERAEYEKFKKLKKEIVSLQLSGHAIKVQLMRMIARLKTPMLGVDHWEHEAIALQEQLRRQEQIERMTHCSISLESPGNHKPLMQKATTGLYSIPFTIQEDYKTLYNIFMRINTYQQLNPIFTYTNRGLIPITIKQIGNHEYWRLESASDDHRFSEVVSILSLYKHNGILYQNKASSRCEKMWGWIHPGIKLGDKESIAQESIMGDSMSGSQASRRQSLFIYHEKKSIFKNKIVLLRYKEYERFLYFKTAKQKKQWMAGMRATLRALIKERPEMASQIPIYTPFTSEEGASASHFRYEKYDPLHQQYAQQAKIIKEMSKITDCRAAISDDQLIVHFNKKNEENSKFQHITLRFQKKSELFLEMKEEITKLAMEAEGADLKLLELAMYERVYTVWVKPKELEGIRYKLEEWLFYKKSRGFYEQGEGTNRLQIKPNNDSTSNFFYSARFLGLSRGHRDSTPTHSQITKSRKARESSLNLRSKQMRQIRTSAWDPNFEAKTDLEEEIDNFLKLLQTNLMNRTSVTNVNPLFVTVDRLLLQHITLQHRFTMMKKFRRPNKRRGIRSKNPAQILYRQATPLSQLLLDSHVSRTNSNQLITPRSKFLKPNDKPSNRSLNKSGFHFSSRSLEGPMKYLAQSLAKKEGQMQRSTNKLYGGKYSRFKHDHSKEDQDSEIQSSFNESVFRRAHQPERPSQFVNAKRNRENYCNTKPCAIF